MTGLGALQHDNDTVENVLVCPQCDALYDDPGQTRLRCSRCHTLLNAPERALGWRLILIAGLSAVLIYGAVTLPFLTINRFWISNEATLLHTAMTFDGPLLILSLLVLALIVLLPLARLGFMLYALIPILLNFGRLPGAARFFRWSEALKPWSMAEIFLLGAGVALIKVADMAEVTFGPAFYMFAAAVVLIWVQDRTVCRHSIWRALE